MFYPARWKKITVDQSKVLKKTVPFFWATRYTYYFDKQIKQKLPNFCQNCPKFAPKSPVLDWQFTTCKLSLHSDLQCQNTLYRFLSKLWWILKYRSSPADLHTRKRPSTPLPKNTQSYLMVSHTLNPSRGLVPSRFPPAMPVTMVGSQSLTCMRSRLMVPLTVSGRRGLWMNPVTRTPPSQSVVLFPLRGQLLPLNFVAPPLSKKKCGCCNHEGFILQ